MKAKLLCFDLDGTLIDSAGDIAYALNRTLRENQKPDLPFDLIVSHIGRGLRALFDDVFPEVPNPKEREKLIERFLNVYEEDMTRTTSVYPGVFEFLRPWVAGGGKVGIITNKNEKAAKHLVEHLGLSQIPWVAVFGADTWPEKKPSPLPLQKMMALAGVTTEETVMIGDGTPDLQSANNAKVRSIAIEFGYTKMEVLNSYRPSGVIKHYRELGALLASLP